MKTILLIGIGGFIGTILRYILSKYIKLNILSIFPFGTLCVNVLGCFAIGILFALGERSAINAGWKLFLATGICGGFTTFSAFSVETLELFQGGRFGLGLLYILLSIALGIMATYIGYAIMKSI